jgi:hypothetical protein
VATDDYILSPLRTAAVRGADGSYGLEDFVVTNLEAAVRFLRSFNGAHDDWADEIERLGALSARVDKHFGPPKDGVLKTPYFIHESEWLEMRSGPEYRCLVAGCEKPALRAGDAVGGLCEEHNGNVGLRG